MQPNIPNEAFLTGEKVYLRACTVDGTEVISQIENHPESRASLFYAKPTHTEHHIEK